MSKKERRNDWIMSPNRGFSPSFPSHIVLIEFLFLFSFLFLKGTSCQLIYGFWFGGLGKMAKMPKRNLVCFADGSRKETSSNSGWEILEVF